MVERSNWQLAIHGKPGQVSQICLTAEGAEDAEENFAADPRPAPRQAGQAGAKAQVYKSFSAQVNLCPDTTR